MADLNQLATDLGTLAADAASYSGTTALDFIQQFTAAYEAETTKLAGQKAAPVTFVTNGFAIASDIADLTGNTKAATLVNDLKTTENDLSAGHWIPGALSLVADYQAFKSLV